MHTAAASPTSLVETKEFLHAASGLENLPSVLIDSCSFLRSCVKNTECDREPDLSAGGMVAVVEATYMIHEEVGTDGCRGDASFDAGLLAPPVVL